FYLQNEIPCDAYLINKLNDDKCNFENLKIQKDLLSVCNMGFKYITAAEVFSDIPENKLPGPFPLPLLGNALELFRYNLNLSEYVRAVQSKYGDMCEIHMAHNHKFLYRDSPNPGLKEIGLEQRGVIANRNLDEWKINRRFLERSVMSKRFLKEFTEKGNNIILDMFKLWDVLITKRQEIDLAEWIPKFAGDAMLMTVTGQPAYSMMNYFISLGYEYNHDHIPVLKWKQSSRLISAVLSIFSITPCEYFANTLEFRERRAYIDSLPEDAQIPSDALSLLITANTQRDPSRTLFKSLDRSLNDQEIGGILVDIFLGSFETTATAICLTIYYVCKYPSVKSKLLSEISSIFGSLVTPPEKILYENIEKLQYCDAIINEVLRLHPIIPVMPRSNSEPVEIGGYIWKDGHSFFGNFQGIQSNERDWVDAKIFDPDRFLRNNDSIRSKNAEIANNKGAFVPFGGGAKSCPGRLWAVVEVKVFLVALLTRYDIEFVNKNQELELFWKTSFHWRNLKVYLKPKV
ncbi:29292_t:CDS:2, partial [Racocetra persica]